MASRPYEQLMARLSASSGERPTPLKVLTHAVPHLDKSRLADITPGCDRLLLEIDQTKSKLRRLETDLADTAFGELLRLLKHYTVDEVGKAYATYFFAPSKGKKP